jgi:benzylsuccinate CoA-transferase BbsF subunit
MSPGSGPLSGVRILDFFWLIAGPLASRVFADYGADVIKVESEQRIDRIRNGLQPPGAASIETSGVFADCNLNKRSITVNLNTERGLATIKELVKISDVVTNNFSGDRMERWGLGYEDLRRIRPDVIAISVPVMGGTGPYRRYGAYGNGVAALGGLNSLTGFPERPPVGVGPLYPDFVVPYFAATALLAALHRRERTGEGCFIDLAQIEVTASQLGPSILNYTENGVIPERSGNRSPYACPHGAFRCAGDDQWCAIAIASDEQWRLFCAVIDRPELADQNDYLTLGGRKAHEDEIEAIVTTWTETRSARDVMLQLQAHGIAAGVVQNLRTMVTEDPQLKRHYVRVPHVAGPTFTAQRQPFRLGRQRAAARRPPLMGEHTLAILRDLLGLRETAIEELLVGGALQ